MKIRNNRLINKVLNVYCNKFCDKKEHLELRYTGYQDLKDQVANDYVYKLLASGKPVMISKFGSVELSNLVSRHIDQTTGLTKDVIYDFLHYKNVAIDYKGWLRNLCSNAGFFPYDLDLGLRWYRLMMQDIKEVDVLGSYIYEEKYIAQSMNCLKRVNIDGYFAPFSWNNPWSKVLKGKKVLVRCDFNVPLIDGKITDENRLVAALPTIKKLIADGGKVILCSHLGKVKTEEDKLTKTLAPVAVRLSELLGQEVKFVADPEVVGPNARAAVEAMKDGEVILLENTRFRPEETKNGEAFSKDLASICDVFVNDAFGTAHRAHCSNVGVAQLVDTAVVGYLMQKEIDFLGNAVENPVRPFVAILGGAKVADKLNVISNLLEKCDTLIIGGGMAYTFLKAQGYEIGLSLVDDSKLDYCKEMMEKAEKLGKKLLLPVDAVTIKDFPNPIDAPVEVEVYDSDKMPADREGCDIGPKTQALFADAVKTAKTVVWNGPMGVFENPTLAAGTIAVAKALADTDATTIIGGGDSAAAVNQLGFGDKMTHISTGGGASLEFLEGKELPGVAAANDK